MAGWWGDGEWGGCVGGLLGIDNGAACEGRRDGTEVWDVCAWDFGCFRGMGSGGFRTFRDHWGARLQRWTGGNLECLADLCGCVIAGVI